MIPKWEIDSFIVEAVKGKKKKEKILSDRCTYVVQWDVMAKKIYVSNQTVQQNEGKKFSLWGSMFIHCVLFRGEGSIDKTSCAPPRKIIILSASFIVHCAYIIHMCC